MFVVSELSDVVRVEPDKLTGTSIYDALRQALNNKFVNKVLLNCGLFIKVMDFLPQSSKTDFHILPGDGAVHKKVYFRAIVFRPFINEVIEGRVRSMSPEGVKISLEFFDDIIVQGMRLPHPSHWDGVKRAELNTDSRIWPMPELILRNLTVSASDADRTIFTAKSVILTNHHESDTMCCTSGSMERISGCWIWEYGTDSGESHNLLLEVGDRIRFRVVDEKFTDCSPVGPTLDTIQQQNLPSSYELEAAMNEPGLGAIAWWSNT